jgi:hypothetical protein
MVPTNIEPFCSLDIWVRLHSIFLHTLIWKWKNLKKKKTSYPTLFILEPQLGHAISLWSFPQPIQ